MSGLAEIIDAVRAVKAQKLRSKRTVNHMNTTTTIRTNNIAEAARLELSRLARIITTALQRPDANFEQVRDQYKKEVGTVIATSVRESYFLGFHFIEEFARRSVQLNQNHLTKMNAEIDSAIRSFWGVMRKEYDRALVEEMAGPDSTVLGAAGFGDFLKVVTNFVSTLAVSMSFQALSQATIQTRQQVYIEDLDVTVSGSVSAPLSMWVSERDGRVCPICTNLDGRTFRVDDDSMPRPGPPELDGASHWGCRCRLLPMDGERVYNG